MRIDENTRQGPTRRKKGRKKNRTQAAKIYRFERNLLCQNGGWRHLFSIHIYIYLYIKVFTIFFLNKQAKSIKISSK